MAKPLKIAQGAARRLAKAQLAEASRDIASALLRALKRVPADYRDVKRERAK